MKHSERPDRYIYPAVFTYDPDSEIAVTFPDLDAATSGETEEDAFASARELLGCVLYGLEQDGEPIPAPSSLHDLHLDGNESGALVDVFMPAVRMAENNKSVSRTVTLPAWLNAAAAERNVNFSQVLQEALKQQIGIA